MSIPVTAAALLKRAALSASWSLRVDAWKPLICAAARSPGANTSSSPAIATHHPWLCQCNNICDLHPPPPWRENPRERLRSHHTIQRRPQLPGGGDAVLHTDTRTRTREPDDHVVETDTKIIDGKHHTDGRKCRGSVWRCLCRCDRRCPWRRVPGVVLEWVRSR